MNHKTPTLEMETELGYPTQKIIGVDEVGRGCLFGSVVAAAVTLPESWGGYPLEALIKKYPELALIKDSKLMTSKNRESTYAFLTNHLSFSIAEASVAEIDEVNILNATFLAMERAVSKLVSRNPLLKNATLLIDGNRAPKKCAAEFKTVTLIKGDQKSLTIACASVIAKVYRDLQMREYAKEFPNHQIELHKGYGTKKHLDALKKFGVTVHHRKSFAPVKSLLF